MARRKHHGKKVSGQRAKFKRTATACSAQLRNVSPAEGYFKKLGKCMKNHL